MRAPLRSLVFVMLAAGCAAATSAQTFDTVGTRAAGMGGAFVAVADDASAAYWNPGGFAAGNYFTMVIDRNTVKVDSGTPDGAANGSGLLVAVGMPALGLSYYRLRSTTLSPSGARGSTAGEADALRLDTLITHHSGITLVQSIADRIAVGATLKLVRGVAASTLVPDDGSRDRLLRNAGELDGKGSSKFDADVGVMATAGTFKAGITVRNLTRPGFQTRAGNALLTLPRQARAGVAMTLLDGWAVAADLDLTRVSGPAGFVRNLAAGTEGRIGRKAFVRGGLRLNTAGSRQPVVAAGASYALLGSVLIDAQVTGGSDRAQHGWGLAARFVY